MPEGSLDGVNAGWVIQSMLLKHFVDVTIRPPSEVDSQMVGQGAH